MNKKQKKNLYRIILSSVLLLIVNILNLENPYLSLSLYLIIYLIIGVAIIFIYTLLKQSIAKELVLISGWVFIWSVVELELFSDSESRKRRIILNKLLLSEFVVNQV